MFSVFDTVTVMVLCSSSPNCPPVGVTSIQVIDSEREKESVPPPQFVIVKVPYPVHPCGLDPKFI